MPLRKPHIHISFLEKMCLGVAVNLGAKQSLLAADRSAWFQQVEELPRHEALDWLRDAAPPAAREDPELLLAAVAKTGAGAMLLAPRALRRDREFVLAACSLNGFALGAAAPELQADRDFVLAVVARDGDALDEVAPALKADREVVISAGRCHHYRAVPASLPYRCR